MIIGDALGMPSEFLTPAQIRREYGAITGPRRPGPRAIHRELPMAAVTDDTEQALYLVEGFCRTRRVSADAAAAALVRWATERDVWNRSYLGPSSARALRRLVEGGDPHVTGGDGSTVGAAMRVAPVAWLLAPDLSRAVAGAVVASLPTHGASVAISGAAAIAAGVAEALQPASTVDSVVEAALRGAQEGERYGVDVCAPSVVRRTELALSLVRGLSPQEAVQEMYATLGLGLPTYELVPAAIALFAASGGQPKAAVLAAANAGGDTDTLGAMVGALAGAFRGADELPKDWLSLIEQVNGLSVDAVVDRVLAAREDGIEVELPERFPREGAEASCGSG